MVVGWVGCGWAEGSERTRRLSWRSWSSSKGSRKSDPRQLPIVEDTGVEETNEVLFTLLVAKQIEMMTKILAHNLE